MKSDDLRNGIGWAFGVIGLGLFVLIAAGIDEKDGRISFSLDGANHDVVMIAGGLIVSGAGIRVFPDKAGKVLPTSQISTAIGKLLTGDVDEN